MVNIRPGVSMLSVLQHLKYKPWFALAEFVDNALQSFLAHRAELQELHGGNATLRVSITMRAMEETGLILVRDNAAGIYEAEFPRAFRPAALPPDRSGLSEFGMGMKSAACFFAPKWLVRTSALGETVERRVVFDIDAIVRDSIEDLAVQETAAEASAHFTEVYLFQLHSRPQSRTVAKIREHLASIYREFLRDGTLCLHFNDDLLRYTSPAVLVAPDDRYPGSPPLIWRKDIDFDFGLGQRVHGFAALRERASTSEAGFALFRRSRLIEGSGDESYRPEAIFGRSNSYRYQRLFGELHLEGFDVSYTKDGFDWNGLEDTFLELLREQLDAEPLPLLRQAESFRVRPRRDEIKTSAETATERTALALGRDVPPVLERLGRAPAVGAPPPEPRPTTEPSITHREVLLRYRDADWRIVLELTTDPAVGDWMEFWDAPAGDVDASGDTRRTIGIRVSLAHPFTGRFAGSTGENLEALLRIAAGIGLAETVAADAGVRQAGTIRRNLNELLRSGLANP